MEWVELAQRRHDDRKAAYEQLTLAQQVKVKDAAVSERTREVEELQGEVNALTDISQLIGASRYFVIH